MAYRCLGCLLMLLGTAGLGAYAQPARPGGKPFDWPQWQGPSRDAYSQETGLLDRWPTDGPPLMWKKDGLGNGYSTPSVAGGRIFGMSYRGTDEVVWALEEATGKVLWSTRIAVANKRIGYGEGSRSTPTVDGDVLYAVGASGDLVCLDVTKGQIKWRKNYATDLGGRMMSSWGFSESILVDGDKVIGTPGGDAAALVAFNKKNGNVLWKAAVPEGGGAGYASVVVAEVGGIRQYITWLGRGLVGVDARTGKLLWRYAKNANKTANIPTPIVRGDHVFCSTGYQAGSALLRLVPDGSGVKAEEVYFLESRTLQNHHGGLVLIGDFLYGGHGHNQGAPICVEFSTGKVRWKESNIGSGSAATLGAEGHIYFRYQDGTMALIQANPERMVIKSKFKLPHDSGKPSWPHPVIANGRMYIRDQDVLMCFNVKKSESS